MGIGLNSALIRARRVAAGLTISAVTVPSSSCRTRTPTVRQLPSTAKARSSTLSAAPEYDAGVNPSRNAMLVASENGPRGTRVKVSIRPSHHQPVTLTGKPEPAYDLIRHI